ncbi:unnamed protein product [Rhizophagus irregularis]|nr:unnamed protein product [Rhizophagus irregularis]
MRICTFNAGLIKEECSTNLQFITESEAVAVYCMENLKKQNLAQAGTNFMVKQLKDMEVLVVNMLILKQS